jgi:hypothetical protein
MKRLIVASILCLGLLVATASTGLANASSNASCIGLGSSAAKANPAFDRDEISHFVKANFATFGATSPGGAYSHVAKLHLGSDAACFAATG